MFCDGCGSAVQLGQSFCGRCGKQITGTITAIHQRRSRVQEHVQLVAILWLAFSALNAVAGIAILIAYSLFGHSMNAPWFVHSIVAGVGWFVLLKSAVGLAAGIGLMQRELWARTLVLILAFIALFTSIPFGTALGIYSLWVLMPRESEQEYEALSSARAA